MLKQFKHPATIIAIVALFASVTGGAYAATLLTGKNIRNSSLTGADVRNSSLTGSDIRNSSLTTSDIRNGTIKAGDLAAGVLTRGPAGPAGAAGAAGPRGETGPAGAAGAAGPSGAKGDTGATGAAGADGVDGDDGADGADGEDGADGTQGIQGPTGLSGAPGQDGIDAGDGLEEYGVAKAFLVRNGAVIATLGTLWTPDVPDDRNNAATSAATVAGAVQAGDQILVTGAVRTEEANGGFMGAGVVVTVNGTVAGGGQTQSDGPGGLNGDTATVAVPALALGSDGPTEAGTEVVRVNVGATGTAVITGTVQAFDFNP